MSLLGLFWLCGTRICFPSRALVPALGACWWLGLSRTHSQGFQAHCGLQQQQQRLWGHLGGTQVSASIGKSS